MNYTQQSLGGDAAKLKELEREKSGAEAAVEELKAVRDSLVVQNKVYNAGRVHGV